MGTRKDRGEAVARYLTRSTGIPFIEWRSNKLDAPAPYYFPFTNGRTKDPWMLSLPSNPERFTAAIKMDSNTDGAANAMALLRLSQFAELLKMHGDALSSVRPFGRSE